MSNKGFAVSGILYTILLIFLALLSMLLWNFENKKHLLDNIKKEVNNQIGQEIYHVYANGYIVYYNPVSNSICAPTEYQKNFNSNGTPTGIKTGCMKWYVFNDNKLSETVNLILDHNTTEIIKWNDSGNNVSYESSNLISEINKLVNDENWAVMPRIITADEVAKIVNADELLKWNSSKIYRNTNIETDSSWFYLDGTGATYTTWQTKISDATNKSAYSWLYDYTNDCETYGCNKSDSTTYGYWTSTPCKNSETQMWTVYRPGSMGISDSDANVLGIRPVVSVSKSSLKNKCSVPIGTKYVFDYTGKEEIFTVPCDGVYELETWGAQGGSTYAKSSGVTTYAGAYGGYSKGEILLDESTKLYINVGGKGADATNYSGATNSTGNYVTVTGGAGGYNGGGSGGSGIRNWSGAGGGGGATHIALQSGLLSSLSSKISNILIVSGGGGGNAGMGGPGGMSSGGGYSTIGLASIGGATQTSGYAFGLGGNGRTVSEWASGACNGAGGGGGGYYGGYAATARGTDTGISGTGGTGYIGNANLKNKVMYCNGCNTTNDTKTKTVSTSNISSSAISKYAKIGNGYVKITYLG